MRNWVLGFGGKEEEEEEGKRREKWGLEMEEGLRRVLETRERGKR